MPDVGPAVPGFSVGRHAGGRSVLGHDRRAHSESSVGYCQLRSTPCIAQPAGALILWCALQQWPCSSLADPGALGAMPPKTDSGLPPPRNGGTMLFLGALCEFFPLFWGEGGFDDLVGLASPKQAAVGSTSGAVANRCIFVDCFCTFV